MTETRPPCLEWRDLLALRREDLSLTEQQSLDSHVQGCLPCRAALADYSFFEARLDALPPPAIKPLPRLSPLLVGGENVHKDAAGTDVRRAFLPRERQTGKSAVAFWRTLSVAAVACLIFSTIILFRVLPSSTSTATSSAREKGALIDFIQHTGAVTAVAWSPNGREIATGSKDHTVKIWDARTGELEFTYAEHTDIVDALAWSPDGRYLASGSWDETVRVWDASSGQTSTIYTGQNAPVTAVAWSRDGKEIVSGGWDDTAKIWNVQTGKILATCYDPNHTELVNAVAWSPDGQEIATGSSYYLVQIWNAQTGSLRETLRGHTDIVTSVAWSPDGRLLVSGSNDGTVRVWNVESQQTVRTYIDQTANDAINAVAWSPDGKYIVSGSQDGTVHVWSPATNATLMIYHGHTDEVDCVAWSPDSTEVVSGSEDRTAQVWKIGG